MCHTYNRFQDREFIRTVIQISIYSGLKFTKKHSTNVLQLHLEVDFTLHFPLLFFFDISMHAARECDTYNMCSQLLMRWTVLNFLCFLGQ